MSNMERLKNSRPISFVIITIVYILGAVVGIAIYLVLPYPWWLSLLLADVASTIFVFLFSLIFENASVYDPYWSVQPPVILTCYAVGRGVTPYGILLLVVVWFWGIRLTANWAYTFHGLKHQDWRYTMLHHTTKAFYPLINLVGIHLVPTLVVWGCILPAVYAIEMGVASLNIWAVLALCLSLGAAVLQGVADIEMHRYRKSRTTPFIRVGLWHYSRHPNYLGEILMWWGVALSLLAVAQEMWYLAAGAFANTLLFAFVSIPMADKRQGRKEGYATYHAETRALLPIPKFHKK